MGTFSISEAKARLSELIESALEGEEVIITRRGKPVAQLAPAGTVRSGIDFARLRALRAAMPIAKIPADKLIRKMRETK